MHDISDFKNVEAIELISRIKSGDDRDEAFSELVDRYMPLMQKRVLSYFGGSKDTAEAMQEARIALHSAALSYDGQRSDSVTFGLFAGVCIENRLKSYMRQIARRSEREELTHEAERISSGFDTESYIATKDLCSRVMSVARSMLSEFEYEVFRLSFEKYTTKDIADKLCRDAKSVDNAKARISKKLRCEPKICEILSIIN